MKLETIQIPANNEAGYVVVNKEDVGTEAVAKWAEKGKSVSKPAESDTASDETAAPDKAELMKLTKGDLVAMAENAGIDLVPDEETKASIVEKILAASAE